VCALGAVRKEMNGKLVAVDNSVRVFFVVTKFYENTLRMKMQLEKTYFDLAAMSKNNCLIICDGGTMDIKARK